MLVKNFQIFVSIGFLFSKNPMLDAFHIPKVDEDDSYGPPDIDYVEDLEDLFKAQDPLTALDCDTFACFLSKYDLLKTMNGYSVREMKVS